MEPPAIFISYARDNKDQATQLRDQFKILEREGRCRVWWDPELRAGDVFDKKIRAAIDQCSLAILCISGAFLKSDYINKYEVPWIRERKENGLAAVVPVLMESCNWGLDPWLQQLNVVPKEARPIWGNGGLHIKELITEVVQEIVRLLDDGNAPDPDNETSPVGGHSTRPLPALRVIEHDLTDATAQVLDQAGRLWLANSQLVRIYPAGQPGQDRPPVVAHLPERCWKSHLPHLWNGRLVLGDWAGGVLLVDDTGGLADLEPGFNGGLPVHRFATGPEQQLAAATWDGGLRVWDENQALVHEQRVPGLPTTLVAMRGHALAVVEDHRRLTVFEADGGTICSWLSPEPLTHLWPCEDKGSRAFIAQAGAACLVKYRCDQPEPERLHFETPITALAHCGGQGSNEWICIARQGGIVEGITTSPFRVLKGSHHARIEGEAASLLAIPAPGQSSEVMAVVLTTARRLCTVNGTRASFHAVRGAPESLASDSSGLRLVLSYQGRSEILRNPGLRAKPSKFDLVAVAGRAALGELRTVDLTLKNTGSQPADIVSAKLTGPGVIEGGSALDQGQRLVPPGAEALFKFSVRALVAGDGLPVTLRLTLNDESGAGIPPHELQFQLSTLAAPS